MKLPLRLDFAAPAPAAFVPTLRGSAYDTRVPVAGVLFLALTFLCVSSVSAFVAEAPTLERRVEGVMAGAVLFNVAMDAVVVPARASAGPPGRGLGESVSAIPRLSLAVQGAQRVRRPGPASVGAA